MSDSALLSGRRVAILVEDEFEDLELSGPLAALRDAGATVKVIGPTAGAQFKGKRGQATVTSDVAAGSVRMKDFDALVIPGGHAPDKMRMRHAMVDLARDAMDAGKPVAAICHGPWVLANADVLEGRTVTSVPNIRRDLENAGATWVDEEVVVDQGLVTSRTPDDLPAFCAKLVEEIGEGRHGQQARSVA